MPLLILVSLTLSCSTRPSGRQWNYKCNQEPPSTGVHADGINWRVLFFSQAFLMRCWCPSCTGHTWIWHVFPYCNEMAVICFMFRLLCIEFSIHGHVAWGGTPPKISDLFFSLFPFHSDPIPPSPVYPHFLTHLSIMWLNQLSQYNYRHHKIIN